MYPANDSVDTKNTTSYSRLAYSETIDFDPNAFAALLSGDRQAPRSPQLQSQSQSQQSQQCVEDQANESETENTVGATLNISQLSVCLAAPKKVASYRLPGGPKYGVRYSNNNMRVMSKINFTNRSIVVDILCVLFGIGTWISVNGTFIQLPLLVKEAPESWSLPSYLSIAVHAGNLGPLIYTLVQHFAKKKKSDAKIIYALLVLGTLSALFTAFFYNNTFKMFGLERSWTLFLLTFLSALTACTSSVLFMPYMGRFRDIYLVTYFVGEGLSGLLPSMVALVQGIGGEAECILVNNTETGDQIYEKYMPPPRFSTMAYFLFIFVMFVCSLIGFILLNRLKLAKREYAAGEIKYGNNYQYSNNANDGITHENQNEAHIADTSKTMPSSQYITLLILIASLSFFSNGIFNSIQSYTSLPYGYLAYHLSVTLSVSANPIACLMAIFLPHTSLRSIYALCTVSAILTTYVLLVAAMSPLPPLHGTKTGEIIVITTWTILIGCITYAKLSISAVMREQGGRSLMWTGGLTQLGAFLGSILIFVLINFTNSFQETPESAC